MTDDKIVEELKKATTGLLVMSESDYPFEIIQWDGQTAITPDYLVSLSGASSSNIQEMSLDDFYNVSRRFPNLVRLLKDSLADLRVYKVGEINIPVYIVGRSPQGNWIGLSTRVVET